jgi:hypothetical protein
MVLAGAYLAFVRLPAFSDLWTTEYGRFLLLKSAMVGFALSWGAVHHVFVRPRLEAGEELDVGPSLVGEATVALPSSRAPRSSRTSLRRPWTAAPPRPPRPPRTTR